MSKGDKRLDASEYSLGIETASLEIGSLIRWLSRWGLIVVEFGMVQVGVQALLAVAGLLIVRTLSKQEYALFAIANSMQTTCNLLADLGIGIGVRSIGGRVWAGPFRFGQLLNTALGLRRRFALLSFGVCIPVAAWMLWRNGANTSVTIALCVAVAASAIPLLASSVWSASLGLHGEYRRMQKLDLGNAALRLALIAALAIGRLNALLAVLVGAVGNWVQANFLRYWAGEHADPMAPPNADDRRELLSLSVKSLPNAVFLCFQGQVTLLILTLVGSPTGIADLTALGRLAALFAVFSVSFSSVLGPRFARCQDPKRLPHLYLLLVGATIFVLLPLLLFAWFFPDPFLWLLGGQYAHLGRECGWVVTAGCVGQIAGVMWNMNSSKAWIRFQAPSFIPMILVTQMVAALWLDLRQFHDVLVFNLVTAASPMLIYALDAYLGCRTARRVAAEQHDCHQTNRHIGKEVATQQNPQ